MTDRAVGRSGPARRVTIVDVARHSGVSPGAVSFALNGRPGVGADTRQRILAAAAELGWHPNHPARSLSGNAAYTMGLVVARPASTVGADPFFPAFVAGVTTALEPTRRSLLMTVVADLDAEIGTYRRLVAEKRVDGVFLTDLRVDDPRPRAVADLGLPAVTLGRPDPASRHPAVGSVSVDDAAGMREVVETLLGRGHVAIAHVTGPEEFLHVRSRRTAWVDALADAGLRAQTCVHTDFSPAAGARATERLLARKRRPTAIVYANDVMGIAGLAVAQRLGIAVPDELSITGFDDTELAEHVHPPLTSVRTDVTQWGERAAQVLMAAAAGGPVEHVELAPAHMITRASISPPAAVDPHAAGPEGAHR